jgi:hypothetical protein
VQAKAEVSCTGGAALPSALRYIWLRPVRVSLTVRVKPTLVAADEKTQKCWLTLQALSTLSSISGLPAPKNQKRPP